MIPFYIISSLSFALLLGYVHIIRSYHLHLKNISHEVASSPVDLPYVSVIIPARNEETQIVECVRAIQQQDYPGHLVEIIVIDDHSTDQTALLAKEAGASVLHLKDAPLSPHIVAYKKAALEFGIKNATSEIILTTDADCSANPGWIYAMVHALLLDERVLISGPVLMKNGSSCLEKFQSLDYSILQGITASANAGGMHDLSSGANLCYRKKAFIEVGGFDKIDHIASGDDMLLQQKFREVYPGKMHHCWVPEAIVTTHPEKTFLSFLRQRMRWTSKTSSYKDAKIKWILAQVYLFNLSLISLVFLSFISFQYCYPLLVCLLIKIGVEWNFVKMTLVFFENKNLMKYFIAFQPLHIISIVLSGFLGLFPRYDWKGRSVK